MKRIMIIIITLGLAFNLFGQQAQEKVATAGKEEKILITPKNGETLKRYWGKVVVITKEDIEKSCANNLGDLLKSEFGVIERDKYGNGISSEVMLNSGYSDRVLVLINGIPVNLVASEIANLNYVDIDEIEMIEIVYGPVNLFYNDVYSGVVNIITKDNKEGGSDIYGSVFTKVQDETKYFDNITYNLTKIGAVGDIKYRISAQLDNLDGWRSFNNGYKAVRVSGNFLLGKDFNLLVGYYNAKIKEPGSFTNYETATNLYTKSTRSNDFIENPDPNMYIGLFYNKEDLKISGYYKADSEIVAIENNSLAKVKANALGLNLVYTVPYKIWILNNKFSIGGDITRKSADFTRDTISFISNSTNIGRTSVAELDGKIKNSVVAFFENIVNIKDYVILSLGARWEKAVYEIYQYRTGTNNYYTKLERGGSLGFKIPGETLNKDSKVGLSPYVGLAVPLSFNEVGITIYGNGGIRYNSPSLVDISTNYYGDCNLYYAGGLRFYRIPFIGEYVNNIEFEYYARKGTESVSALDSAISFVKVPIILFDIKAHYSYVLSMKKMLNIPKYKAGFLAYRAFKNFDLSIDGYIFGKQNLTSIEPIEKLNEYFILNAKLGMKRENYSIYFWVENILDKKYVEYANSQEYYPACGRVYSLKVNFKF